jgi:hypothetical protein
LGRDSGLSIDTLQRTFYTYLDESPDVKILKRERVHLRIDATYFKRFCALCYQDHEDGYTQLVRFSDGEHFEEIRANCANWCFKSWRSKPRTTVFTGLQEKTFNQSTGRYWHTHKLLRRSYLTIKRALPNMFHYLTNPKIPATTNGIEGFFSHLKNHLDLHRGLTLKHRVNFIKWYVYLSNDK